MVFVWWSSWGIPHGVSEDNVSIKEVLSPVEIASDFIISAGSEIVSLKNQLKANSQEIASGTPEDNIATVIKGIEDVEKIRTINNIVYPDEIFAPGTSSLPQKQN